MKLIAPYYQKKEEMAQAWFSAIQALPPHMQRPNSYTYMVKALSTQGGKWETRPVPGVATFRPDSGKGFAQGPAEWYMTPDDILALNEVLKALFGEPEQEKFLY